MSPAAPGDGTRLSALHAATFFGVGIYLPFFPVWLASKTLSPAMISFVLSIAIIVRILTTAPLLALADRRLGPRRLLLASHAAQVSAIPCSRFSITSSRSPPSWRFSRSPMPP